MRRRPFSRAIVALIVVLIIGLIVVGYWSFHNPPPVEEPRTDPLLRTPVAPQGAPRPQP